MECNTPLFRSLHILSVHSGPIQSTLVIVGPLGSIHSTSVLFYPLWLCLVSIHFGFIRSIRTHLSTLVIFSPLRSNLVLFGPMSTLVLLVSFGPFCPLWSYSVLFNPLRSYSVHYVYFSLIQSHLSTLVLFGFIQSTLVLSVLFGAIQSILSTSVLLGPTWSTLVPFGPFYHN